MTLAKKTFEFFGLSRGRRKKANFNKAHFGLTVKRFARLLSHSLTRDLINCRKSLARVFEYFLLQFFSLFPLNFSLIMCFFFFDERMNKNVLLARIETHIEAKNRTTSLTLWMSLRRPKVNMATENYQITVRKSSSSHIYFYETRKWKKRREQNERFTKNNTFWFILTWLLVDEKFISRLLEG